MKLIPDWRQAWRYHSVILATALAAANFARENSDTLQLVLPASAMHLVNVICPLVIVLARVIKQTPPAPEAPPPPAAPAPASKEPS